MKYYNFALKDILPYFNDTLVKSKYRNMPDCLLNFQRFLKDLQIQCFPHSQIKQALHEVVGAERVNWCYVRMNGRKKLSVEVAL